VVNDETSQTYILFDKSEKHPVNLFILNARAASQAEEDSIKLFIMSNKMTLIHTVDLKDIQAFILHEE